MKRIHKTVLALIGLGLAGRALIRQRRSVDLTGQVVLITGGSRGLGLQMAHEFARAGCRLALCARDASELAAAKAGLEARGAEVLTIPCDISDPIQVATLIETVTARFGRIDILVNNAGIIEVGPVQDMTLQDFERAMAIDFWGVLHPILAVLPQMRARKTGRIVNITSIGGKVSVPHLLPYSCAKFAATGLSEGLRAELSRDGIQVTTIVPGLMRTGSFLNAEFKGDQKKEFTWFALSDNLPGISMSAERAAREIIASVKRGDAERILTFPAQMAAKLTGLFPSFTADLAGVIDQAGLPQPAGNQITARGEVIQEQMQSPTLETLTMLGQEAAHRLQPNLKTEI